MSKGNKQVAFTVFREFNLSVAATFNYYNGAIYTVDIRWYENHMATNHGITFMASEVSWLETSLISNITRASDLAIKRNGQRRLSLRSLGDDQIYLSVLENQKQQRCSQKRSTLINFVNVLKNELARK